MISLKYSNDPYYTNSYRLDFLIILCNTASNIEHHKSRYLRRIYFFNNILTIPFCDPVLEFLQDCIKVAQSTISLKNETMILYY